MRVLGIGVVIAAVLAGLAACSLVPIDESDPVFTVLNHRASGIQLYIEDTSSAHDIAGPDPIAAGQSEQVPTHNRCRGTGARAEDDKHTVVAQLRTALCAGDVWTLEADGTNHVTRYVGPNRHS